MVDLMFFFSQNKFIPALITWSVSELWQKSSREKRGPKVDILYCLFLLIPGKPGKINVFMVRVHSYAF